MTEFEKITPETYEKMNEEFEEEGLTFSIIVPTQEQIDKWSNVIDDNFRKNCCRKPSRRRD